MRTMNILNVLTSTNGKYPKVALRLSRGKNKKFRLDSLVASAFVPKVYGKPLLAHLDGDIYNNAASNLKWLSYSEAYQLSEFSRLKLMRLNTEVKPLNDWAETFGVNPRLYSDRWHRLPDEFKHTDAGDLKVFMGRDILKLSFAGLTRELGYWAKEFNIDRHTLYYRLKKGWSTEEALTHKFASKKCGKNVTIDGKTKRVCDWLIELGLSRSTYAKRKIRGWSDYAALVTPPDSKWRYEPNDVVIIKGVRRHIEEWCEIYGITKAQYLARRCKGMSPQRAITCGSEVDI